MASESIKIQTIKTQLGDVVLGDNNGKLCLCIWANHSKRISIEHRIQRLLKKKFTDGSTPLLQETAKQIGEYISQKRTSFNIDTEVVGSVFQQEIWSSVDKISYGKTYTFKSLAQELGMEESIRPMAAAISTNPLSILTPCHRIVSETKGIAINFEEKMNERLREIEE